MAANARGAMRPSNANRTPSFIFIGLLVVIAILGFNYWNVTSKNAMLSKKLNDMSDRFRKSSVDKAAAETRFEEAQLRLSESEKETNQQKSIVHQKGEELNSLTSELNEARQSLDTAVEEQTQCKQDLDAAFTKQIAFENVEGTLRAEKAEKEEELQTCLTEKMQAIEEKREECNQVGDAVRIRLLTTVQRLFGDQALEMLQQNNVNIVGLTLGAVPQGQVVLQPQQGQQQQQQQQQPDLQQQQLQNNQQQQYQNLQQQGTNQQPLQQEQQQYQPDQQQLQQQQQQQQQQNGEPQIPQVQDTLVQQPVVAGQGVNLRNMPVWRNLPSLRNFRRGEIDQQVIGQAEAPDQMAPADTQGQPPVGPLGAEPMQPGLGNQQGPEGDNQGEAPRGVAVMTDDESQQDDAELHGEQDLEQDVPAQQVQPPADGSLKDPAQDEDEDAENDAAEENDNEQLRFQQADNADHNGQEDALVRQDEERL